MPEWQQAQPSLNNVTITRLNGLSNACYSIAANQLTTLLYRKFLCTVSNKEIEEIVFKAMHDKGFGPRLVH